MQLLTVRDYLEMSLGAANIVSNAVTARPNLTICLPTGRTPKGMYRELVRRRRVEGLSFFDVIFFNLDEYVGLAPEHTQSFRSYLRRELFDHINVGPANIYPPDENYEDTIRNKGGVDLLISGIGANGHIAFNEPGSILESRTRIVDLAQSTLDGMRANFTPEELPRQAITIGLATIMEARRVLLLASGKAKAQILARALTEPINSEVPASVLQGHPDTTVIADEAALEVFH